MFGMTARVTDNVTPWLRRLQVGLDPDKIKPVAGRSGQNLIRNHLFALDRSRANDKGGRRTHFYAAAARSTNFREVSDGVEVSINHVGIAQRFFGGTILPVNSKYLTIPASPEAHGRRAREFDNLEVVFGRRGPVGLRTRRATMLQKTKKGFAKGKEVGGEIMYRLVRSSEQKADPSVLPTEEAIHTEVREDVLSYLKRI